MPALQSKVKSYKDISRRLKALEAMAVDHFILPSALLVSIFFLFFWLLLKDIWPFNPKRLIVVFTAPEVFLDWGALNHHFAQCYIKQLKDLPVPQKTRSACASLFISDCCVLH